MSEELISRLQRVQQVAGVMRDLMREAQAAAPAGSRAQDSTGAVTVVLDAEGQPVKITVAAAWRQRLGTRTLGAAVMDASGKAAQVRMRAWTGALQEGVWARKMAQLMASGPEAGVPEQAPEMFRATRAPQHPHRLGDLADEMVKAIDASQSPRAERAAQFRGTNSRRTVAITLSASGLTGCAVDTGWVNGKSGAAVSAALTAWYLPDFVKNAIRWCADQLTTLLAGLADTIVDLLQGAVAPVRFFVDAYTWQDVRGLASGVAGRLKPTALQVDDRWSGSARDACCEAIAPQSNAADRIAAIANRAAQSLTICACSVRRPRR